MPLFAVMTPGEHVGLQAALNTHFANDHLKVGPGQYLVAAKTTVIELSNTLGISDGQNGLGIIVSISAYYGRANQNVWEWMSVKGSTPWRQRKARHRRWLRRIRSCRPETLATSK